MSGLSEAQVDRAALNYLNRFDSSVSNLRQVLKRQLRKRLQRADAGELDPAVYVELDQLIDRVLERFERSGLLDDGRYAKNMTDQLRRRGTAGRAIRMKLLQKGLSAEHIDEAFEYEAQSNLDDDLDPELSAAIAYARRRRLGIFRNSETRPEQRQKDLAALARRGFSFRTALQALTSRPRD